MRLRLTRLQLPRLQLRQPARPSQLQQALPLEQHSRRVPSPAAALRAGVALLIGALGMTASMPLQAAARAGSASAAAPAAQGNANGNGHVNTSGNAARFCQQVSERLPGTQNAACRDSGLLPSGARSRNGLPILVRRYPPPRTRPGVAPVRILLLGGIHGDELTSSAIVFRWMQSIQGGAAQNFQWEVVPVLNPDGLLAARPNRVNAGGVDLNRNFPTPNWAAEAPRYWVRETGSDPRRYPGRAPLSEPETRWVNEELARFKPNVIISVHAPFGVLDFDGPAPAPQRFGRLALNPVGVYPGSLGNYSGKFKNVPVITIELPHAQTMPSDEETRRIWSDMLDWINRNVAHQAGASTG